MDTLPPKLEIGASRAKLAGLFVLGIGMTGLSALLAVGVVAPGAVGMAVGAIGALFFGFATFTVFRRLVAARGPIVTLDGEGIRDVRISETRIPWSAVRDITTWQSRGTRLMLLKVDPAFADSLGASRFARMMRRANRALGADGIAIGTNDLKVSYRVLFKTARAYWEKR